MKKLRYYFAAFLTLISSGFLAPLTAMALSDDRLYMFAENNIYFYDPDDRLDKCYTGTAFGGDTNFARVVEYFAGNNPYGISLSPEGIAGIVANFSHESGLSPFRNQGQFNSTTGNMSSSNGYGIAQFTGRDKILGPLKTDSRTAGYFDEYYKEEYGGSIGIADDGVPDGVPVEVNNAFLAVELDFIVSSELTTTKVGSYRNLGGTMGLDYIPNDATILEALAMAKTPEDAARVFVWIYERPADKEGAASGREATASSMFANVQSLMGSSGSYSASYSYTGDGSNVTIIGDSISVGVDDAGKFQEVLPGVDVHAQVSKHFYADSGDNQSGYTILQNLANSGELRDIVVFALGTNDGGGITEEQAQAVLDVAGGRKVVFVTNFTTSNDYIANNNIFTEMKNTHSNVSIADWKAAVSSNPSEFLSDDGIHPNDAGKTKFAQLIASAAAGINGNNGICYDGMGGGALRDGGMTTVEDAQDFMTAYRNEASLKKTGTYSFDGAKVSDSGCKDGTLNNCSAFSQWFVNRYTTAGEVSIYQGSQTVKQLLSLGKGFVDGGHTPAVYAIVSMGPQSGSANGWPNHTGVVLGIDQENDVIIIGEASCSNGFTSTFPGAHSYSLSKYSCTGQYCPTYAYTDNILKGL